MSSPTVYMWCAHTIKPNTPIDNIAYTIPKYPKIGFLDALTTMWLIIPKPGKIRIYTSGWPKNQNRCWYSTGSPPPIGSKKVVLKFRSVSSIVIAAARTGSDNKSKTAVIKTAQTNKGNLWKGRLSVRIFTIVQIKLIAPKIEDAPERCRLKIAKSTAPPECAIIPDKGG